MSEKLKRRRLPRYVFFPVIVAILLLVAAKLVALQRADLIAHLTYRIAHAEPLQAQAAVRQLAAIPDPPMPELVEAAVSPNREIAQEAQHAIGEIVRAVQRNIDGGRSASRSARQLSALVDSLAHHHADFLAADHGWLGRTTRQVVRLANQLPVESTPLVASQCDVVLASITDSQIAISGYASAEDVEEIPLGVTQVAISGAGSLAGESMPEHLLDERYAVLSSRPFSAVASVAPEASAIGVHEAMITPAAEQSSAGRYESSSRSELPRAWQPRWTQPMFFPAPAMPINVVPLPTHDSSIGGNRLRNATGSENRDSGVGIEFTQLDSRELLAQWLVADGPEVDLLEHELTRRGFGRLSPRLVEQYFSADVEDRLRLVDQVLAEPGVDARPWVMLLAEDPSADVRLMIVTIMATSNDPELLEKAWEVAIHDRDPRIASLAERLRERRASDQSF